MAPVVIEGVSKDHFDFDKSFCEWEYEASIRDYVESTEMCIIKLTDGTELHYIAECGWMPGECHLVVEINHPDGSFSRVMEPLYDL